MTIQQIMISTLQTVLVAQKYIIIFFRLKNKAWTTHSGYRTEICTILLFEVQFPYTMSIVLFRQLPVRFTVSNITHYHLKYPGIVENPNNVYTSN